jgi:hypothetical protein
MRARRGERERFARFGGRRRVWRLGGGVSCEEGGLWWRAVGGLASTVAEIDDDVEEARRVRGGSFDGGGDGQGGVIEAVEVDGLCVA